MASDQSKPGKIEEGALSAELGRELYSGVSRHTGENSNDYMNYKTSASTPFTLRQTHTHKGILLHALHVPAISFNP